MGVLPELPSLWCQLRIAKLGQPKEQEQGETVQRNLRMASPGVGRGPLGIKGMAGCIGDAWEPTGHHERSL